ncbi:MAG: lysophospholipase [Treponema sp.]|jgi:pimeloyl-ACP methyl ester carboxylesterase|nr:lysophospholipase [Treponema sp.]
MKKRTYLVISAGIMLVCALFAGCTIVALEICAQAFDRVEESFQHHYLPYRGEYPREELRFNSGGKKLQGFIYGGSNGNGLIVLSEGLGCTADYYFPMIRFFVDKGWRVFAFNNTGVSGSEGESIRGLTQSVVDLDAALAYVKNSGKFDGLPVMLAGHSWGGYAVCAVLNYHHRVNAVVSFAGYNNGGDLLKEQGIMRLGGAYYVVSPQLWAIEKQLFGSTAKLTALDGINKAGIPVMIAHSSNDDIIPAGTTSIYARRGKITNPLAKIIYKEGEDAAGHWPYNDIYGELDIVLMERIHQFFNNAH